eukprot:147380_1
MGNSISVSRTKPDRKLLVTAYINQLKLIVTIPYTIIDLCYQYYHKDHHYVLSWQNGFVGSNSDSLIKIIDFNHKGNLVINNVRTLNLHTAQYTPVKWNGCSEHSTIIIPKIYSIPNWFASQLKKKVLFSSPNMHSTYDMVIRFGSRVSYKYSYVQEMSTFFGIYKYPNNSNGLDLPIECFYLNKTLNSPIQADSLQEAGIIYSSKRNSVLVIGGQVGSKILSELSINNLKWKMIANISKYVPVQSPAVCLINKESDLVMIGGYEGDKFHPLTHTGLKYSNKVQMYSMKNNKIRFLQNMHVKRYKAACVVIEDLNKIIVGGGWTHNDCVVDGAVEIFDMYKNEWFLHPAVMNYKGKGCCGRQCLLYDVNNYNIIYYVGRYKVNFEYKTIIEWIDLRDNYSASSSRRWNLLCEKSMEHVFRNVQPSVLFPALSN